MKFLLTNDDGIHAPGLAALGAAAAQLGESIVVAPDQHLSGCSHQATTHRLLAVSEVGPGRFAIDGTPADCARVGLLHLAAGADWALSGINDGANLGADVYHSGTVAAVREASMLGFPGIAFSQYRRRGVEANWDFAVRMALHVLPLVFERELTPGAFWNVNLPDLGGLADDRMPEVVFCSLDPHPLPVLYEARSGGYFYQGDYHNRQRKAGADVEVCFSGCIAVTQLLPYASLERHR